MRSVPVILILCLTALMVIPSTVPRVGAVLSNGSNYCSSYGPSVDNLVYKVYNDYTGMFTHFQHRQLDYSYCALQRGDLARFITHPDFFVAPKTSQAEEGTFQLDVNYANPL